MRESCYIATPLRGVQASISSRSCCSRLPSGARSARRRPPATPATAEANAAVATSLPLGDRQDFDDVAHGRVAGDPNVVIADAKGRAIWDTRRYEFVQGDAPPTVNPSGRPRGVRR